MELAEKIANMERENESLKDKLGVMTDHLSMSDESRKQSHLRLMTLLGYWEEVAEVLEQKGYLSKLPVEEYCHSDEDILEALHSMSPRRDESVEAFL
jgi:hypothetical protein